MPTSRHHCKPLEVPPPTFVASTHLFGALDPASVHRFEVEVKLACRTRSQGRRLVLDTAEQVRRPFEGEIPHVHHFSRGSAAT